MSDRPPLAILKPDVVLTDAGTPQGLAGTAVLVRGDRIERLASAEELRTSFHDAESINLAGMVLIPGLVNAHQHGRAVSTFQLGQRDDFLEPYMVTSRLRPLLDPRINVGLVSASFIAGGVTTAVQTNTPLGSGNYERELRSMIEAYDRSGLRTAVAVGCMDRGHTVYDDEDEPGFLAGLSRSAAALAQVPQVPLYAGSARDTVALADRLLAEFGDHSRIRMGYGPAGPQWASDAMLAAIAEHAADRRLFVHFHGMESLAPGQKVMIRVAEGQKGLQVIEIRPA